jgi:hypothetical protein
MNNAFGEHFSDALHAISENQGKNGFPKAPKPDAHKVGSGGPKEDATKAQATINEQLGVANTATQRLALEAFANGSGT